MSEAIKWLKKDATGKPKFYESPFQNKSHFIRLVAGFLKSKKHEWYVVGFVSNESAFGGREVKEFYVHKGQNREGVPIMPEELILNKCKEKGYDKVLEFHNHPNGSIEPSGQDKSNFRHRYRKLSTSNISMERYICARGECESYGRWF